MSSPYVPHPGDHLDRQDASSPVHSTMTALDLQEPSIRPMRLKVLYSFDLENKTNCLARWPEILNIRTAHLDEHTQIGVVELKTCIKAIVDASPEILSKLGQDYTVYAYDYSEYDTPQVGQGMLSRVLAAASPTPSAPAAQSDTVVTGRVCRSMLGLFANGIQETLEVKLRLVPVPNSVQNEYVESMKQQREQGQNMPEGVDPRAWAEFLRQNPGMLSVVNPSRSQTPTSGFAQPAHGLEQVQRLISEGYRPPSVRPHSLHRQHSYAGSVASAPASNRSGSPTPSLQSLATTQPNSRNARPASRASNEGSHADARRMSIGGPSELGYDEERSEDGPARKRARVTKVDHPGKSNLGKTFDTLRATASTAASIRVLQPTAVRPAADAIRSLEAPPRAPTPTPATNESNKRPATQHTRSGLGRELSLTSDSGYRSLYSEDNAPFIESAASSPDPAGLVSDYNSPEEPTSSPPVYRPPSVARTSPMLPAMPPQPDTFNDADLDNLFGDLNDPIESIQFQHEETPQSTQYMGPELPAPFPDPVPAAPRKTKAEMEAEAAVEAKRAELSFKNARRAIGLGRAQTWSGETRNTPVQVQPESGPKPVQNNTPTTFVFEQPKTKKNNWNKVKRKKAIQTKLQASIEAGEMPPYCQNCGAIETPTWRKAYSKLYSGDHNHFKTSDEDGGIVCIQVVEKNEDGSTKFFKVYKKVLRPDDDGFSYVLLCNPCGIWLSNRKSMRPETHWERRAAKPGQKKKSRAKKNPEETDLSDAANVFSEGVAPTSEAPASEPYFGGESAIGDVMRSARDVHLPTLPSLEKSISMPEQATGMLTGPESGINPTDFAALQRAIQSSPSRFLGFRRSLTGDDKQSPDPARRSLFSSPKSGGPLGVDLKKKSPTTKKSLPPKTPNELRLAVTVEDETDKENQPPQPIEVDDLDDLFSDLPTTPSRKRALSCISPGALFKTPAMKNSPLRTSLATGDFFSTAAKAFLHGPQTPNKTPDSKALAELTPFTRHLNQLLSEPNMDSPSRFLSEIGNLTSTLDESNTPLMDGSTPSKMFRSGDFDFSDFPSSDGPMPSSPPAWFAIYKDHESDGQAWELALEEGERAEGKEPAQSIQPEAPEATTAAEAAAPAVAAA